MHIPDQMIRGETCWITNAIAIGGVATTGAFLKRTVDGDSIRRFASVSAFVFLLQMLNFPVSQGTSGHALGTMLAVALLGLPLGALSLALVMTIQTLLFADGGLTVLGANIVNMALVGAGAGETIRRLSLRWQVSRTVAVGLGAWASVIASSLVCSFELAWSGAALLGQVLPAMTGVHTVIGFAEGCMTAGLVGLFYTAEGRVGTPRFSRVPLFLSACVIALLLIPFASSFPDGLEWVAQKYQFAHGQAPLFTAPLADYTMPWVTIEPLSAMIAGLVGAIVVFAVASGCVKMLKAEKKTSVV